MRRLAGIAIGERDEVIGEAWHPGAACSPPEMLKCSLRTARYFPYHVLAPVRTLAYIVTLMRLKTSIWVAAYLRRCQTAGVFGAVRRRGAEEAGAVFIKVATMDGGAMLYVPAPQTVYDDSRPIERLFMPLSKEPQPEPSVEERLTREIRFDPDAWIVETEDKAGRHFLDLAKG